MNETSIAPWGMKAPGLSGQAEQVISEIARRKSGWTTAWLAGQEDRPNGGAALVNAFQQSVWVYACVTTLAENVSGIPFRLLTGAEDDERLVGKGDGRNGSRGVKGALELFARPHPQLDRFQFWELLVSWLMLRGEVFIAATDDSDVVMSPACPANRSSAITRLHILGPDGFREVVSENRLEGWHYQCGGEDGSLASHDFLPGEVIHIKLPNPFHFWRGMSPLSVAMLAAQTDYASAQFMRGLMLNNADTGLIVTTDQHLQEEQRVQLMAVLRERKRKAGTADRPIVLESGMKVEKPALSSADLQMLENRKFNRQEICAIYKVPQELLGFSEDANRAIADAVRMSFMENRIAPLCRRIEAGIDPVIKGFERGQRGEFHVKGTPIMQAAQRARVDSAVKVWSMAVPFNEVNRAYDLGFPKLPWGDKAYLATNVQEVGESEVDERACSDEGNPWVRLAQVICEVEAPSAELKAQNGGEGSREEWSPEVVASVRTKEGKLSRYFFEQRGRALAALRAGKREEILDVATENELLLAKLKPLVMEDFEKGAVAEVKDGGPMDRAGENCGIDRRLGGTTGGEREFDELGGGRDECGGLCRAAGGWDAIGFELDDGHRGSGHR